MEEVVVGRITVREEGISSPDETALPDVYPLIQASLVQHIRISEMDFSGSVRISQTRELELFQQLIIPVDAAVSVDKPVLRVKAPVDGSSVTASIEIDPLDDPASLQGYVRHIAAACPTALRDVEQRELRRFRSFLGSEAGVITVSGIPGHEETVDVCLFLHVEYAAEALVVHNEGVTAMHGETLGRAFNFDFRWSPVSEIADQLAPKGRVEGLLGGG